MRLTEPPQDVSQATLYVAAKMQDTIKKPQDILEVGYTVRYPHLVSSMTGVADIDGEVRILGYLGCQISHTIRSEKRKIDESS